MKHLTVEQLNGLNKAQVIEHATTLQTIPVLIPIPAIEGKEQFTNEKGIIVPAVVAVPAKGIQEQISALAEVAAYFAACSEIDKANEGSKLTFETSAEFLAGKNTLEILTKFETENKEKIASVVALNEKFNAENSNTKTPARLRNQITAKIVSEIEAIENTYTFSGGTVSLTTGYPVITFEGKEYTYEGTLPELPTFTPAPYPVFTSKTLVTVLLSYLFSGKTSVKAPKAPKAPKVEGGAPNVGSGKDWNDADIAYIKAQLALNVKFSNIYNHLVSLGYSEGQAKGKINTIKKA